MTKYSVLLIGYGNMGREWAKVLTNSSSADIAGVADMLEDNRKRAKAELGLRENQVAADLKTLLETVHPDIVLDCSPPFAHPANTLLALEHGCHVLGEKPISLSFDEAAEIVAAAAKAGKIYMVNQNYRAHPMVEALRKYLEPRPLGDINSVDINYAQNFQFNDTFRYQMNHPLLTDMAIHHFDLVRSLTGSTHKSVYCREYNPVGSRFKNGASAAAIFEMSDGSTFSYQGSWNDVSDNKSFVGNWRIACENGTLHWDGVGAPEVETIKDGSPTRSQLDFTEALAVKPEDIFQRELSYSLEAMVSAIESGAQPSTWCGDNIHTLDMVLGAIESSEKRTPVAAKATVK